MSLEPDLTISGLPVVESVNPVASATALARQCGGTLAIGPRASEEAIHATQGRLQELQDQGSIEAAERPDVGQLRALADDLVRVRRVLAKTRAGRASTGQAEPQRPEADGQAPWRRPHGSANPGVATVWVALLAIGILLTAAASLLGAPSPGVILPIVVAAVAAGAWTATHRQDAGPTAEPDQRAGGPEGIDEVARPAESAMAVAVADAVVRDHERRWVEMWERAGLTAPEPDAVDATLAARFGDANRVEPETIIDLRDPPAPLVVVEPFDGLGPHRAAVLRGLLGEVRDLLVAVVVKDASTVPHAS